MKYKCPPYNTGKVKIGAFYEPPRQMYPMRVEEYRLQSQIMGWHSSTRAERMTRLAVKVGIAIFLALLVFVR
jgi:hypothetical protein